MTEQSPTDQFHASSFIEAVRVAGITITKSPARLGQAVPEAIG
jgi:hypothetical protein